jgi:hypothetical protein
VRRPKGFWATSPHEYVQLIAQAAGLIVGLAAAIYFAGLIVVSLRLSFEHLPWVNEVSELPRQTLLSVGAGEVLLPALLVGGTYALYRLGSKGPEKPAPPRWRHPKQRGDAIAGYIATAGLMVIPLSVVLLLRGLVDGFEPQPERIVVGYLVLLAAAIAFREARAALIHGVLGDWKHVVSVATIVSLYTLGAMPAMIVAASAIPLSEATVCTTYGRYDGYMVGETNESVFLGQHASRDFPRRLAVIPQEKVNLVFTGRDSDELNCPRASTPTKSKR